MEPAGERFVTVRSAGFDEVLRGVSFTPGAGALSRLASPDRRYERGRGAALPRPLACPRL
jgi:hypothetical protein